MRDCRAHRRWLVSVLALLGQCRTLPDPVPLRYRCHRAAQPIVIDGVQEAAWDAAPWTADFVDIEGAGKPRPRFRTRARMLWDDECFYVAASIEEPHVCATLERHDEIVFHDDDFEVFLDPDGDTRAYYEIEVNALNTVFDLFLERMYRDGGPAHHEWDLAALRTAVHVDGTLNDPADTDRGWSVEIAMPWRSFGPAANMPCPPRDGDTWRVNFSRVEWRYDVEGGRYCKRAGEREDNWVWSPQALVDMHLPRRWGYVTFVQ
ncbi:MAG: carbohydrate-binding family 9-like protein [Planctomycetota bacterium]